jgi:hypothetical protein
MGLLESSLPKQTKCQHCGYAGTSVLLDCMHCCQLITRDGSIAIANECTSLLLRNLPFGLWLSTSCNPSSGKFRSTLDFYDRVSNVLENVILVNRCQLENQDEYLSNTKTLTICILTSIPFQHTTRVLEAAVKLVELLARLLNGSSSRQTMAFDCLTEAAGGSITPQGDLVPMSQPLHIWLDTPPGTTWFKVLLSRLLEQNVPAKQFRLVGALLRSHPALFVGNPTMTETFLTCVRSILANKSASAASQVLCLEMLQGLLRGRIDYPLESTSCETDFFDVVHLEPSLLEAMRSDDKLTKQIVCELYGCFLPSDWEHLLQRGHTHICVDYFQLVVDA